MVVLQNSRQNVVGKFLSQGLECYKNIQLKACDITKLTAELKSDSVQWRNKMCYLVACFCQVDLRIAVLKIIHSSSEPGELSQWLCHDDSTVNIVVVIIIINYTSVTNTVIGLLGIRNHTDE